MSSIGSIISGSVQSSSGVKAVRASSAPSSTRGAQRPGGDATSVSGPAAVLSKLKSLQQSDPAKFKEVMTAISTKLQEGAEASGDATDKAAMTDLAQKFQAAAQTGDLSTLVPPSGRGGGSHHPPGPPPGGGGKPPGAVAKSGSSSSSSSTEAADTNADGKVSEKERQAYEAKEAAAKEAAASPSSSAAGAYEKQASGAMQSKMNDLMSGIASVVDTALTAA